MKINLNGKDLGWASAVVVLGAIVQMGVIPITATLATVLFFAKKFGNIDNKGTRVSLLMLTGFFTPFILGIYAAILQPNWKPSETEVESTTLVEPTPTPELVESPPITPDVIATPTPEKVELIKEGKGTIKMCDDLGCDKEGVISVSVDPQTQAKIIILGAGDTSTGEAVGFGLAKQPGGVFQVLMVADENNLENPTNVDSSGYNVSFDKKDEIVITDNNFGNVYTFHSSTIPFPTN